MASLHEIQALVEQIKSDLPLLVNRSQIAPRQIVTITGLSDISERLGLVQAGEFRTGNGLEPGYGFSGVRMGYPAFVYDGDTWNIVGVNNDVMQVGVRSFDGKLYAGGGKVILDADGIKVINENDSSDPFIRLYDSDLLLRGSLMTSVNGNLELIAWGYSPEAARKLVLRAQHDSGATNIATLEVISNHVGGGNDYITLSADHVVFNPNLDDADFRVYGTSATPMLDVNAGDETVEIMGQDALHHYIPFTMYAASAINISVTTIVFIASTDNWTLYSWRQSWLVVTTNDGSNYWTIEIVDKNGAILTNVDTTGAAANTWSQSFAGFSDDTTTTSDNHIYVRVTKVGSPGNIHLLSPLVLGKLT